MKRALIFDFGGVLMKTLDYAPRHAWDERLNLSHGSVERIVHGSDSWRLAQTGLMSVDDYWRDVARQLELSPTDVQQLATDFYSGDQLDSILLDYIRHQRTEGFQIALLSNDASTLRHKLRTLAIDDLFDPLVISAEIGVMKPNTAAFEHVLRLLQRPAEETIFIDDNVDNCAAAVALGIHAVHYIAGMNLPAAVTKE